MDTETKDNYSDLKRKQLLLPAMEIMAANGGEMKASDVVDALADRFNVPDEVLNEYTYVKSWKKKLNPWKQNVHWMRLDAVIDGYFERKQRGLWTLSDKGYESLGMCAPGVIFTIYETANGQAVWAEAETAAGALKDGSVNLLFSSPPYPLEVGKKDYGNKTGAYYVKWIADMAKDWKRALTDDGSLVLNLGDVWNAGSPTRSLYIERLLLELCDNVGLYLADRGIWEAPNRIPSSNWTTIKRVRLNSSHEHLLWLSKGTNPKANNRNVLEPYVDPAGMKRMMSRKTKRGASGHLSSTNAFKVDNGGRIPHSVIQMPNASGDHAFSRACKEAGIIPHPARMPIGLAEFYIKFLTDIGDHVHDPFAGSATTLVAAEKHQRRWSGSEKSLEYIRGQFERFKINGMNPQYSC